MKAKVKRRMACVPSTTCSRVGQVTRASSARAYWK